jgi:hypothetical protein
VEKMLPMGDMPDEDDTYARREKWRKRQGRGTRRWQSMTGEKAEVVEEVEVVVEDTPPRPDRASWSEVETRQP